MAKHTLMSSPILCLFVLPTIISLCVFCTLTLRAQPVTYASSTARPVPGTFVIRRARVFDGVRALANHTDVFVQHGHIKAVGDNLKVPAGTHDVDGTGDTLLPGLIDAHTHMRTDALKQALIFGVTTELDMFSNIKFDFDNELRKNEAAGTSLGSADFRTAGTVVTVANGHGTEYTLKIPVLDNAADAQSFVDARIAEGSDYIKIIYDFGTTIPTLSKEELFAVVAAGHKRHKLAVVHISTQAGARDAIEAGADGLAHTFQDSPPAPDFAEQVKKHDAFVVPTLTVMESATGTPSGASLGTDPGLDPYINAAAAANLKMSFHPRWKINFAYALASVKLLHDAGVPVLAGTDAPNPGTAHGVSIHRELELLVQAGLTPEEALAAATSLPAQAFGLTDRGRIAPGLRADLLLVKGDPTKAIMDTRAIVSVWKMGVEDDRGSYRAAIESQKAAPPLDPSNPANPVSAQNASSPSQAQQPGMNPRDRKLSLTEIRSLIVGKTVKWDDGGQSVYETVGTFRYTKMGRSSEGDYQITDGAVCVKFMNGGVLRCDAWYRDGQSYYIKTRNDSRFNVLSID